ncbi:MAG: hypothetical protein MR902_05880 [Campylobacter sp.]|nr:hypothetical protein [Campylobacter sp.]
MDRILLENALNNPLENILYFEENGYEKPHYYIILPTIDINKVVILSMITSQVKKRKEFYNKTENFSALQSLLEITENDLDILIKDS